MKGKSGNSKQMKDLEEFSIHKGAFRAKVFPARLVAIDERVRMKCQIPLCPHYGHTLTCPPNIPTVDEFRKALALYNHAILVQTRSPIGGSMNDYDREDVREAFTNPSKKPKKKGGEEETAPDDFGGMKAKAIRLHTLVNEVELRAMSLGFPYALGLIGGECMLCARCVGVGSSHACRKPYEARPSMEGVGIDCIKTCQNAGLPFEIPPKTEIIWSGLILID